MDKNFQIELENSIKENQLACSFIKESQAIILLALISEKFRLDFNKAFLWDDYRVELISSYENNWDNFSFQLSYIFTQLNENIFLVLIDEKFPFPILKIKNVHLKILLADTRYFEYFITDENFKHLIFDTHHNKFLKLLAE